jgi:uncharacterized protein YndB with AHSA1/START domain
MPVKKDDEGRRYVQAEVEVPGSPDEVWDAIATASGISSWFVPTRSDEREGGEVVNSFGPGMDSVAKITSWDPPRSFTAESEGGPGTVATEWIVEARDGGQCVVRVVHRWFADSDDWDGEFEGHAYGWAASFFRILRLYLEHFAGVECAAFDLAGFKAAPPPESWTAFTSGLHLDRDAGQVSSASGTPELAGVIQSLEVTDPALLAVRETAPQIRATLEGMEGEDPELLLRLERPAPGLMHAFSMAMGGQTMISIRVFLYGDEGVRSARAMEAEWREWLGERFSPQPLG